MAESGEVMEAWLIYYRDSAEYNKKYIEFYIEEGKKLDIHIRLLLVEELEFGVKDSRWFLKIQNCELPKPDFVICRAIYPLLCKQLELMGIRVFNNSFVAEICNDKAKTYQYLAGTGIKMIDSSFYRNGQLKEILYQVPKRTVIKAVDGHGGSQVFLINEAVTKPSNEKQSDIGYQSFDQDIDRSSILDAFKGSDAVIQPLTGSRHQDLRVYVIGKDIIASVLRTAKEGFRSNYSLGGEVSLYQLSEEEKEIIYKVTDQFDFGLVGIDFIIGDEGELIFNEIEDVVGSRMLYQCSDINIVERYLIFIKNKITESIRRP